MKKPYDRVTEAYFSELGDAFAHKTRKRIHWICAQAHGSRILDVGCSQGITSILLGREGKQVTGIDLLEKAITYAREQLELEEPMTQENVEFVQANFINEDFKGEKFDSIVFGEVLEHISDPIPFLEKAASLLNDNGRIVVTLPFGINDYFDHKKTYYLMDLLRFQNIGMDISSIKFFGKWIGAIFEKTVPKEQTIQLNEELVRVLEKEFEDVERMHLNTLQERRLLIERLKEKVERFEKEKMTHNKQLQQSREEVEALQLQNTVYKTEATVHEREIDFFEKQKTAAEEQLDSVRTDYNTLKEQHDDLTHKVKELSAAKDLAQKENEALVEKISDVMTDKESLEATIQSLMGENERYKASHEELSSELQELNDRFLQEKTTYENSVKQYKKKLENVQQNANDQLVKELNRQVILERKEKIKVKEQLVESINKEKNLLNTFNRYQKSYQEEIQSLKARHTVALREKIDVKEQLQEAYQKEARILTAHQKLLKKYKALSESKLGRLTLARWEKRTQKRNKAKRRSRS